MTQEEIIRMAFEAGASESSVDVHPPILYFSFGEEELELFAALVSAHTKEEVKRTSITMLQDGYAAVLAEREACAKVCEEYDMDHIVGQQLAADIRARSNK